MTVCNSLKKLYPKIKNIVLTTEDPHYLQEWPEWTTGEEGRDWRFILNPRDVHQGTGGNIANKERGVLKETFDKDISKGEILSAMMSSLYLQLHGRYLVLMCHSNWHRLIERFAQAGYECHLSQPLVDEASPERVSCSPRQVLQRREGGCDLRRRAGSAGRVPMHDSQ
mmetsp:Transcript_16468/g.62618  ORF Transcript_16468/g.62618 Transcript_16468/m.62618 type:complete len:168 (-) Transcript_16468:345-848(-)